MILATTLHGSKLYRLDTPQSDTDYKSIFLPPIDSLVLMRAAKNAQHKTGVGADKEEHESFALQEWLRLAANGEDVAITMLHCQPSDIFVGSDMFLQLRDSRRKFYTRHMRGALGYARSQCHKYAVRADRMEAVESVIKALELAQDQKVDKLAKCWDDLPEGKHIVKYASTTSRSTDLRMYEVVGRSFAATTDPAYVLEALYEVQEGYGGRVRNARNFGGKDWKSISHSFRVGYQLKHIFNDGDFSFPLPESSFLRDIRAGRLNYEDDKVDKKLSDLIDEVERASATSSYPETVDQNWLDSVVLAAYGL